MVRHLELTPLYPRTLGFDRLFDQIEKVFEGVDNPTLDKFPPHNIVKLNDTQYVVELAVAGFSKNDIDITVEDSSLVIKGTKAEEDSKLEYLHRGIGTRAFTKTIKLADTVQVSGAEFKDDILRVGLQNIIPEEKKPRKIEIGKELTFLKPELLTE
jgi:molecular chaperone IbpA